MPCCAPKNYSKKQTCDLFLFCTQTALCSDTVRQWNLGVLPIIFFPYQDLSDLSSAELNKRLLVVPVTQSMEKVPPAFFMWAKFHSSVPRRSLNIYFRMPLKYSPWLSCAISSLCFISRLHPRFHVLCLRTPRRNRKLILSVFSPMWTET